MDRSAAVLSEAMALQEPMNKAMKLGNSAIQMWYKNSVVFITGATGFLGKHLIEKLLRSCEIKRIYVLVRNKKSRTIKERWEEILKDPVFDHLHEQNPHFPEKIQVIEGDISDNGLGISNEDWHTITEEVDVIFHVAATTRFDEPIKRATFINVRGTLEAVKIGKECKRLRSFVHLSTAFCHATTKNIDKDVLEEFYPTPIEPETLVNMAENMDEKELIEMTETLMDSWPNTYTFTKALAEEVVRTHGKDSPINIVRPPLVAASYYEPTPGWLDISSMYGPSGIILGIGLGINHVVLNKKNAMLAYAPVDYVTNASIAAGWDAGKQTNKQPSIYTISNIKYGFHWGKTSALMNSEEIRKLSTPKAVWRCFAYETDNRFIFWLMTWLLHYIPAYIADVFCSMAGVKIHNGVNSFVQVYTKIYKSTVFLAYFLTNEFNFKDSNTERLLSVMSEQDRAIFNFDMASVNWPQMFKIWCTGLRKFVIKDGLKNTNYAYKKQEVFKYLNYLFLFLYVYIWFKIFSLVFYFVM